MASEIICDLENQAFLEAVSNANEGDDIQEKYSVLRVVKKSDSEFTYEERLSPTVLYRRTFQAGVLLRKQKSKAFIFVPADKLV